jgi:hypothetical protein
MSELCWSFAHQVGVEPICTRDFGLIDYDRVLFCTQHHGVVYSCSRIATMTPGSWMQELETALSVLSTFTL